jgi:hypothetical protein
MVGMPKEQVLACMGAPAATAQLVAQMPLPIASEVYGPAALHCQRSYAAHLIAIRDAR